MDQMLPDSRAKQEDSKEKPEIGRYPAGTNISRYGGSQPYGGSRMEDIKELDSDQDVAQAQYYANKQ